MSVQFDPKDSCSGVVRELAVLLIETPLSIETVEDGTSVSGEIAALGPPGLKRTFEIAGGLGGRFLVVGVEAGDGAEDAAKSERAGVELGLTME